MPTQNTRPLTSPQTKSKPPENVAEAPFNDLEADLILRSSDEVHFYVIKKILTLASPTFADKFSTLPAPPHQKSRDILQVVPLPELSTTLDLALRHIYPVRAPKTDTLHNAFVLAEFAKNYKVEVLDHFIASYLTESVQRDPVGVYAIAVTYGYKGIGIEAARLCLTLPFSMLKSPYVQCATADHISDLFRYHVACGEVASTFASTDRTWLPPLFSQRLGSFSPKGTRRDSVVPGIPCPSCPAPDFINQASTSHGGPKSINDDGGESSKRTGPLCLWSYLYRSALVLVHHPTPEAIAEREFVLKANNCRSCAQYMEGHLLDLSIVLGGETKKAIERVCLPEAVSLLPSKAPDTASN